MVSGLGYGSSGAFRHPLALNVASSKISLISEQLIRKPSWVTIRLFSRMALILQQASNSWGDAAMRYASLTCESLSFFFFGNRATTDESDPTTLIARPFLVTYQEPFACFPMHALSAKRKKTLSVFRTKGIKILFDLFEIDIPLLHICAYKLHLEPMAYVDAFSPVEQPAFDRRLKDADPCPFVGGARADGVEPVSNP
jgi:hypothetical protein